MSVDIPKTHDVFLSYSSSDKSFADAACAVLEKHRVRCWIAPRDITPGDEWGAAIIKGLNASRIMVLIFSGHANASAQVRREVERAISRGQMVLPVRIENIVPEGAMEYALGNTHWLDAFTPPIESQLEAVTKSVKALLAMEPDHSKVEAVKVEAGKIEAVQVEADQGAQGKTAETVRTSGEMSAIAASRAGWRKNPRHIAAIIVIAVAVVALGAFLTRGWWGTSGTISKNSGGTTEPENGGTGPHGSSDPTPPSDPVTIDLMSRFNADAVQNRSAWRMRDGALFSSGKEDFLRLPVFTPEQYRLELTVARARPGGGMSDFMIGVVCGENRCAVLLDGWSGTVSGISWIDGKVANENETKYTGDRIFRRGHPADIVVTVRRNHIVVTADGRMIIDWRGDSSRLSIDAPARLGPRVLTVGTMGGVYRIDKLTLTPLTDSKTNGQ